MSDKGYTTKERIETFLDKTITDSLSPFILSAQKYIDEYTGRNFKADITGTARYFNGAGSNSLRIDDCVSVSEVAVGNDEFGDTFSIATLSKCKFLPNNYAALDVPITEVVSREYDFTVGLQNHKITAKWGYSTCVPNDIQFVATVLAAGMYLNNQGMGSIASESIGAYSVTYDNLQNWSDFKSIGMVLDMYKKYSL